MILHILGWIFAITGVSAAVVVIVAVLMKKRPHYDDILDDHMNRLFEMERVKHTPVVKDVDRELS